MFFCFGLPSIWKCLQETADCVLSSTARNIILKSSRGKEKQSETKSLDSFILLLNVSLLIDFHTEIVTVNMKALVLSTVSTTSRKSVGDKCLTSFVLPPIDFYIVKHTAKIRTNCRVHCKYLYMQEHWRKIVHSEIRRSAWKCLSPINFFCLRMNLLLRIDFGMVTITVNKKALSSVDCKYYSMKVIRIQNIQSGTNNNDSFLVSKRYVLFSIKFLMRILTLNK